MAPNAALDAELAKSASRVISHMNKDHPNSVLAYAHHYLNLDTATRARMIGLTSEGFEVSATLDDGQVVQRLVRYSSPLERAAGVHKLAVAMHFEAFNALGFRFKLRHGYFWGAARQAWHRLPTAVRYPVSAVLLAVLAGVAQHYSVQYGGLI